MSEHAREYPLPDVTERHIPTPHELHDSFLEAKRTNTPRPEYIHATPEKVSAALVNPQSPEARAARLEIKQLFLEKNLKERAQILKNAGITEATLQEAGAVMETLQATEQQLAEVGARLQAKLKEFTGYKKIFAALNTEVAQLKDELGALQRVKDFNQERLRRLVSNDVLHELYIVSTRIAEIKGDIAELETKQAHVSEPVSEESVPKLRLVK